VKKEIRAMHNIPQGLVLPEPSMRRIAMRIVKKIGMMCMFNLINLLVV